MKKPLIVTDHGYYSQDNMMRFASRNMKFLTLVDSNVVWVRKVMDALREGWRACPARVHLIRPFAVPPLPEHMVSRQPARKAICAVCFTEVSLFPDKKIKEVRDRAGKNERGKSKALVKLEKKLDNWLEQRSFTQILDWFDCIGTTNVQTAMGNYRWSTESVARDQLFLKYLGVIS